MSLITAKKLFERSFQQNFSLAAFNVFNVESLQAVVEACEHEKSPAIIQISSGARKYMQDEILFLDYVKAILEKSKCSFVLHHDHIKSVEEAKKAVDMGFSSVMFDGSALPFEENVTRTREIVEYAHKKGVWVEAELGSIPGFEDEVFSEHAKFTDKESVNHFIEATGCDSLAVSVGTAHGGVLSAEHLPLHFDILEEILQVRRGYIFVLHGGASMPKELINKVNECGGKVPELKICSETDIAKACKMGVKKVNMDVDNFLAFTYELRKMLIENSQIYDPRKYLKCGKDGFKEEVIHKLKNVVCSSGVEVIE